MNQTTLRAGTAGIITARNVKAGEVVQAVRTVYTLAQDGPRDAIFNVYESIFIHEPAGRTIRVALVADPGVTGIARPREISPVIDPASCTVRVRLEIIDPPPAMTLGAALIGTGQFRPRPVIMLPWNALSSESGEPAPEAPPPMRPVLSVVVDPTAERAFGFTGTVEPRYRVLALIGILIRNSVILVVQIDELRREGKPPWEAVIEATEHRMRPIILTAAAASLALIPISREVFWGPMAYAMMGGIIVGTVLTLVFLPALYVAWFRITEPAGAEPDGPAQTTLPA